MGEIERGEEGLEGILKQILRDHRDNSEVTGLLVLVFEGDEAHVYSSNIKKEVVDSVSELLGQQH